MMVNMWFVGKIFFGGAEDPVLILLMAVTFWEQKIGRSSAPKLLDAEDSVLFCINKSYFLGTEDLQKQQINNF